MAVPEWHAAVDLVTPHVVRIWTPQGPEEETRVKCVICWHGETGSGKVTVMLERDGTTLVIKGVPEYPIGLEREPRSHEQWIRRP